MNDYEKRNIKLEIKRRKNLLKLFKEEENLVCTWHQRHIKRRFYFRQQK
jgi:GMP synthase-like glutamine amidotransferase